MHKHAVHRAIVLAGYGKALVDIYHCVSTTCIVCRGVTEILVR